MSRLIKVLKAESPWHFASIVVDEHGQRFYVSSCWTSDCGYETMAFLCDDRNTILSWNHVLSRHYPNFFAMVKGHKETTDNIENYLGEGVDYFD